VSDLTAAAADSGNMSGDGSLLRLHGGVLSVDAGHDVSSPFLHVTAGENRVQAGGSLTKSRIEPSSGTPLGALFSMQDARLDVRARGSVAIESAFNPTMLVQPAAQPAQRSYFFTYGADAGLSATSIAGDVDVSYERDRLSAFIGQGLPQQNSDTALSALPPNLELSALSGDLNYSGTSVLFPAARSNLELFAARDLNMVGQLIMSDAAANGMPSALAPQATPDALVDVQRATQDLRHAGDAVPVRISAGRDLRNLLLQLPKAAQISAGRDVRNLTLQGQNLAAQDQTRVSAGRDILLGEFFSKIEVGGPGRLDVLAGRDIDLGFSEGISTTGRLRNPLLPTRGADITAVAGLTRSLDVEGFVDQIIAPMTDYAKLLIDFVGKRGGESSLDFAAAREKFDGMSADAQRPLLIDVLFKELVFAGREANRDPASNFARGYAAIDALFKGSRDPDPEGTDGFVNPFTGDLKLAFSRIYTLSGGDINLLVPGGLVDVGLAVPPAVGAPQREPDDLGIVAQRAGSVRVYSMGDVLVNQSRVFTLAGGDIAIWSTLGDIDAGRGAKSAISAPAPQVIVDGSGNVQIDLAGAVAGSGIRGILTDPTAKPGDVDLIAPAGIVNAGDAGIGAAGNLNVAAQQVVGLDNIQVGGTSTGVPADTSNLGASLSGVSAVSSSASQAATKDMGATAGPSQQAALADTALGWLDVFLEGFGEEVCKASDQDCLDRSKK
jgi:filamentous hemagglutinin